MKEKNNVSIATIIIIVFFIVFGLIAMTAGFFEVLGKKYALGNTTYIIFGFLFFLLGLFSLFMEIKERKMKNTLHEEGRRVMADIHEVITRSEVQDLSYCVICKWKDDKDDIHLFRSDPLADYPQLGDLKQLPVFVNGNDFAKYHVDLDAISFEKLTPREGEQCLDDAPILPNKTTGIINHMHWGTHLFVDILMMVGIVSVILTNLPAVTFSDQNPLMYTVMMSIFATMIGSGLIVNALLLRQIFSPKKTKPALLVSVEKTAAYVDAAGKSLYLLKFQDGQGIYYFFPINDERGYVEGNSYNLTIKAKKVINVGAQTHQRVIPKKMKPGYWSGTYSLNGMFNAKKRKWIRHENPLALMYFWLYFIIFIVVILVLLSKIPKPIPGSFNPEINLLIGVYSFLAILFAYCIIIDFIGKRKGKDE